MAYLVLDEIDAQRTTPDADAIFAAGTVMNASTEPQPVTEGDLLPDSPYTVFAAARDEDRYSEVRSLKMTTESQEKILSFVSASKTGFSYRIDRIGENQKFVHTYLEKWAYDELTAQYSAGGEFDRDLMLCNALADYGFEATGPQTVTWQAGDDNPPREGPATIVGGKPYYAVACLADPVSGQWIGKPETVSFTTEEPGTSAATIEIIIKDLTTEELLSRIEPDESIRFYFYHLFEKEAVDEYLEQFGQEAFENYIYENGYASVDAYDDHWRFSTPGGTYLLAVLGIDMNGDTVYVDRLIEAPQYVPDIALSMQPYENEIMDYYEYQSLEVCVEPQHLGDAPLEQMMWSFSSREMIDELCEMLDGATIEECILQGYLTPYPLAEEWSRELNASGRFIARFNDLEEQTQYTFIVLLPLSEDTYMVRDVTAATTAMPPQTEPDPEYLACLGSWTLTGKSTEDWSSPMSYDLQIEQLTPNRSYLVRGWSKSQVGMEHPFVMNYDPATKEIFVRTPQLLGETNGQDGNSMEIFFTGLYVGSSDDLSVLYGPSGIACRGRATDQKISLIGELFDIGGKKQEIKSLGYSGRTQSGTFRRFEADEYDPIYYHIVRAEAPSSAWLYPTAPGAACNAAFTGRQPNSRVRILFRAAHMPEAVPAFARRISPAFAADWAAGTQREHALGATRPIATAEHCDIR